MQHDSLRHMLDECRFVSDRLAGISQPDFREDETLKRALVRSLEIIGAAAERVPEEVRSRLPDIEWRSLASMRDVLNHQYFGVDYDDIWEVVASRLPELRRTLEGFLGTDPRPRGKDMAFNAVLAERVRKLLHKRKGIADSRMFGGVAYLLNGHMCCGVRDEFLILHLGEEGAARALDGEHVHEIDFTPRPFKSMVCVSVGGYRSDQDLRTWVSRAVAYVKKLPPK